MPGGGAATCHVASAPRGTQVCRLLSAERASFFLVDTTAHELVLHKAKGADDIRVPIGKGAPRQ